MLCRRVRSFLSAYCSDELDSRRQLAVREHLADCGACRKEEAVFRQMAENAQKLPQMKVSDDFNARLLNRIADERFAETRSKAYLPKKAPSLFWRRVLPVFSTACVAILVAITALLPTSENGDRIMTSGSGSLDDSYLTAQPVTNPNMTVNLQKDWSFGQELARTERINRISNTIAPAASSGVWRQSDNWASMVSSRSGHSPFITHHYRMRPVVKVYVSPKTNSERKGINAY